MVGVSWYVVVANGGRPPDGDMIGHAAAAEWLRTLPWWDWRGWSDWFYGGQAIGVNYPPLGHAWMRFTHPVHGQMAAVAIGLLVLLPWGALRLARAMGLGPRTQRAAVAYVLVLTVASGHMWWVLSGFHSEPTFFGSWPTMLAVASGLYAVAWAARCERPLTCGAVVGIALLFNATVVPGIAVVCAALLATSGASFRQATRWSATAGAAALTVSAWWLMPFLAGWSRLVRWEVSLSDSWSDIGTWGVAVLAVVGVAATWAARLGTASSRRLAIAALAGLLAAVLADLFGYLRPERWLEFPIIVAVVAAASLFETRSEGRALKPVRPAWLVLGVAVLIVFVVITLRLEALPLGLWLMWRPRRSWAWSAALAWAAVLLWVPLWAQILNPALPEQSTVAPLDAAAAYRGSAGEGLVYVDHLYSSAAGDVMVCKWGNPWRTTAETNGAVRPLFGLYRETSATSEFLSAEVGLRGGRHQASGGPRPHWFDAWHAAGSPTLETAAAAEALGARWYASCDSEGNASVVDLPGVGVAGVTVVVHATEEEWHQGAAQWWVSLASGSNQTVTHPPIPILGLPDADFRSYPANQAASDLSLHTGQDRLTLVAQQPGWAWIRVPWDPHWQADNAAPVHKGGPGHLVVWAERGTTELRWQVPGAVDGAAAAASGAALLASAAPAIVNSRRGFPINPDRPLPASGAVRVFVDTVDGWAHTCVRTARRCITRSD